MRVQVYTRIIERFQIVRGYDIKLERTFNNSESIFSRAGYHGNILSRILNNSPREKDSFI